MLAVVVEVVVVEVEQVFHHCGKAFLRSQLWDPESWRPDAVPHSSAAYSAGLCPTS